MRRLLLLGSAVIVPVLLAGCADEEIEQTREVLIGTYLVDHPAFVGGEKSDSVTLSITDNRSYVFDHYPNPSTDQVEFCGSAGRLGAWGSNVVRFTPEQFYGFNCDQLRVPRGEFQADFRNHRDTVWLDKTVGDSTYSLRLVPRQ